jgi:hypothetical protein
MTLSDLASVATVISGVAVLGSLIYLGLQTRQNTRHIKALLWQGAADRGVSLNLALADADLVKAFIARNGGTATQEAIEQRQFHLQCIAHYVQFEDMFSQWEDDLMTEERFARYRSTMVAMLREHPANRRFFSERVSQYAPSSQGFHACLRDMIKEVEEQKRV